METDNVLRKFGKTFAINGCDLVIKDGGCHPHQFVFRVSSCQFMFKGALSRQFCYILVKTAQIFDKEFVF